MAAVEKRDSPRWGALVAVFVGVLLGDQLTKLAIENSFQLGETHTLFGDFALVYTHNDGVAFGVLGGAQTLVIVFTVLALIGLLVYFSKRGDRKLLWLPTGLLLGGAIGNLIDRIRQDAVTDFVKVPYWPVFNIADIAITIGVVLLVIAIEVGDGRKAD